MALDASPSRGSPLEKMYSDRQLAVNWSLYFRFTVSMSSPLIESRRSTTMPELLPAGMGVADDGERLSQERCQPEFASERAYDPPTHGFS